MRGKLGDNDRNVKERITPVVRKAGLPQEVAIVTAQFADLLDRVLMENPARAASRQSAAYTWPR